jgi:hypothetical protein
MYNYPHNAWESTELTKIEGCFFCKLRNPNHSAHVQELQGEELNTLMDTLNSALRIRSYLSSTYGMQIMCIEKWSLNNEFMAQNDIHMNP